MYNTEYTHPALDKARAVNKQYKNAVLYIALGFQTYLMCFGIMTAVILSNNKPVPTVAVANR